MEEEGPSVASDEPPHLVAVWLQLPCCVCGLSGVFGWLVEEGWFSRGTFRMEGPREKGSLICVMHTFKQRG